MSNKRKFTVTSVNVGDDETDKQMSGCSLFNKYRQKYPSPKKTISSPEKQTTHNAVEMSESPRICYDNINVDDVKTTHSHNSTSATSMKIIPSASTAGTAIVKPPTSSVSNTTVKLPTSSAAHATVKSSTSSVENRATEPMLKVGKTFAETFSFLKKGDLFELPPEPKPSE